MKLAQYRKFIYAVLAGLAVALPALSAAQTEGVSTGEWLTILGLFLPAVVVGLSPANALPTKELVKQIEENPNIDLKIEAHRLGSPDLQ